MSLAPTYLERAATEALDRGDPKESVRLLREALNEDPNDYRCLVMLSFVLREEGDALDSAATAERAVAFRPNLVEAYYQLGISTLELGRPEQAVMAFSKAVALRPEVAEFHSRLGSALEQAGRPEEARKCLEQAARLTPSDLNSRLALARRLLAEDDVFGARSHTEAALAIDPNNVTAHLRMSEIALAQGLDEGVEDHLRKALAIEPDNVFGLVLLGSHLSRKGRFDEAEGAFRRSIALNPNQGFAYLGLAQARRIGGLDKGLVAQMERVRDRAKLSHHDLGSLNYALARCYEEAGDFGRAMSACDEANRNACLARYGTDRSYEATHRAQMEAIRQMFPSRQTCLGAQSELPIFIVGMIRSGTTLAEQILSCHPDIAGAGEIKFWQRHAESPELMAGILSYPERARNLTETYLRDLERIGSGALRVVDKLPGNYQRIGLLRELLPNARIIHCKRNPIDNALSIYMTPTRTPAVGRSGVVFGYRQYEQLMSYWRDALGPDAFLDIRYEELVSDPEPVIRRMLEFCGLEWNDACLRPEQRESNVATPSMWQVRQPIYTTSVGKWRRYEPWLGEFVELLES